MSVVFVFLFLVNFDGNTTEFYLSEIQPIKVQMQSPFPKLWSKFKLRMLFFSFLTIIMIIHSIFGVVCDITRWKVGIGLAMRQRKILILLWIYNSVEQNSVLFFFLLFHFFLFIQRIHQVIIDSISVIPIFNLCVCNVLLLLVLLIVNPKCYSHEYNTI